MTGESHTLSTTNTVRGATRYPHHVKQLHPTSKRSFSLSILPELHLTASDLNSTWHTISSITTVNPLFRDDIFHYNDNKTGKNCVNRGHKGERWSCIPENGGLFGRTHVFKAANFFNRSKATFSRFQKPVRNKWCLELWTCQAKLWSSWTFFHAFPIFGKNILFLSSW